MSATARPPQAHSHASGPACARPRLYNPRHPERTLLYQTIAEHFETWHALSSAGQFDGQGALSVDNAAVRIDAVAFIRRFGASLNGHCTFMSSCSTACLSKWRAALKPMPMQIFNPHQPV